MSFSCEKILEKISQAHQTKRLAHAYLLTGNHSDRLSGLALEISELVLEKSPRKHPDFHCLRPESKSRRILADDVRSFEKALYLKPYSAPMKVAVIFEAERMCLGKAEAANVFLKTLEEPPSSTLIFLLCIHPQLLLPTITSRCIHLRVHEAIVFENTEEKEIGEAWFLDHSCKELQAYQRARLIQGHWRAIRVASEKRYKEELRGGSSLPEENEGAKKAMLEADFTLERRKILETLQRVYLGKMKKEGDFEKIKSFQGAIQVLDILHQDLETNMDPTLAVERACLKISGLVD